MPRARSGLELPRDPQAFLSGIHPCYLNWASRFQTTTAKCPSSKAAVATISRARTSIDQKFLDCFGLPLHGGGLAVFNFIDD
jgi:hypothetical protein